MPDDLVPYRMSDMLMVRIAQDGQTFDHYLSANIDQMNHEIQAFHQQPLPEAPQSNVKPITDIMTRLQKLEGRKRSVQIVRGPDGKIAAAHIQEE